MFPIRQILLETGVEEEVQRRRRGSVGRNLTHGGTAVTSSPFSFGKRDSTGHERFVPGANISVYGTHGKNQVCVGQFAYLDQILPPNALLTLDYDPLVQRSLYATQEE